MSSIGVLDNDAQPVSGVSLALAIIGLILTAVGIITSALSSVGSGLACFSMDDAEVKT